MQRHPNFSSVWGLTIQSHYLKVKIRARRYEFQSLTVAFSAYTEDENN